MAMGRKGDAQDDLFISHTNVKMSAGHPFYVSLEKLLRAVQFDKFVEEQCQPFYAKKQGRPGLAPGVYFRCLLVGFFEGIESERGIAWRIADSLSLRSFLGIPLSKNPPDHSTLSRTRRLLDVDVHQSVFNFVLGVAAEHGLVKGKSIGVDATTLEANAALKSVVRRDDGTTYSDYLTGLAKASGIETPTREDLARVDRKRKKKGSNEDWVSPSDPDAQISKMKTGGTRLAHKHEHAVDLDTGAIVGTSLSGGATGDTSTLEETMTSAQENLDDVRENMDEDKIEGVSEEIMELTTDKGYHSNAVMLDLEEIGIRGYISEPKRGRRNWKGKEAERDAVYRNRRRVRGKKGKRLLKKRGEMLERPMALLFNTGGMRRVHLRGHENINKRLLVHIAGFNLALVMRSLFGVGKPRRLQGNSSGFLGLFGAHFRRFRVTILLEWFRSAITLRYPETSTFLTNLRNPQNSSRSDRQLGKACFATGC
jgi:transposase